MKNRALEVLVAVVCATFVVACAVGEPASLPDGGVATIVSVDANPLWLPSYWDGTCEEVIGVDGSPNGFPIVDVCMTPMGDVFTMEVGTPILELTQIQIVGNDRFCSGMLEQILHGDQKVRIMTGQPAHGTVVVSPDWLKVTYKPNEGFIGNDYFTYSIGLVHCETNSIEPATVKITVAAPLPLSQ